MAKYTVQEVVVTSVTSGKKPYNVAEVTYTTDRGENKSKKVMSFSNPAVFNTLQNIKYPTVVEVENDGAPYYNWKAVKIVTDEASDAPKPAVRSGGYVDNRETPAERAMRQVMIVKQSSLGHAVSVLGPGLERENYTALAQYFVDWVVDAGFDKQDPEES